MKLNQIPKEGLWDGIADFINENFNKIDTSVESLKDATVKNCGYFSTLEALQQAYPKAGAGSKAYVGANHPYAIYLWDDSASAWVDSGETGGGEDVNLSDYYTKEEADEKYTELGSEVERAAIAQSLPIDIKDKVTYKDGYYVNANGEEVPSSFAYVSIEVEKDVSSYIFNAVYTDRTYQLIKKKNGVVVGTYDSNTYERQDIIVGEDGVTDLDCDILIFNFNPFGGYEVRERTKMYAKDGVESLNKIVSEHENDIKDLSSNLIDFTTIQSLPIDIKDKVTYKEGYIKGDGTLASGFSHLELIVEKDFVKIELDAQFFSNGYPIIKYKGGVVFEKIDLSSYERQNIIVGEGGITGLDCDKIVFNIYPARYALYAVRLQPVNEAVEDLRKSIEKKEDTYSPYQKGHFFGNAPCADYKCLTDDTSFGLANTSYEQLIEKYDSIIDNILCKSFVIGKSCDDKDIMAYALSAPVNEFEADIFTNRKPKLMVICGQHGFEKSSAYGALYLLNDILNHSDNDSLLMYLKNNVELIIVPCVNPSGWNAMDYKNANGVNLNRNWDNPNWNASVTDTSSDQYQGDAPFDQPETACIRDYIVKNKDIDLFVDFHTNGGGIASSQGNINWVDTTSCGNELDDYYNSIKEVVYIHAQNLNGLLRMCFDEQIGGDKTKTCSRLTYNKEIPTSGYADAYCITQNIIALTLEGNNGLPNEDTAYSQYEKKANAMILGNFLATFIGIYSTKK